MYIVSTIHIDSQFKEYFHINKFSQRTYEVVIIINSFYRRGNQCSEWFVHYPMVSPGLCLHITSYILPLEWNLEPDNLASGKQDSPLPCFALGMVDWRRSPENPLQLCGPVPLNKLCLLRGNPVPTSNLRNAAYLCVQTPLSLWPVLLLEGSAPFMFLQFLACLSITVFVTLQCPVRLLSPHVCFRQLDSEDHVTSSSCPVNPSWDELSIGFLVLKLYFRIFWVLYIPILLFSKIHTDIPGDLFASLRCFKTKTLKYHVFYLSKIWSLRLMECRKLPRGVATQGDLSTS